MRRTREAIEIVAASDLTVLLSGETGTGKNLVADVIHARSSRRLGPCVRVDCSAICPTLFESELFGHVRGAFTGAVATRAGRLDAAADGTLLLDEIGELSFEAQGRLLRVIEERTYERVGDNRTCRFEARLIAATSRDLRREVALGRFRPELYHRLNVFPIHLPTLRERRRDIPDLVQHFLASSASPVGRGALRIDAPALERLQVHHWPGNVRELHNTIARGVLASRNGVIDERCLRFEPSGPRDLAPAAAVNGTAHAFAPLEEVERLHIAAVLEQTGGVIEGPRGAARILALSPSTTRFRIRKLGIRRMPQHGPPP
jgi:transcriptional regulator with GAF, ATPase, and Fis domain